MGEDSGGMEVGSDGLSFEMKGSVTGDCRAAEAPHPRSHDLRI